LIDAAARIGASNRRGCESRADSKLGSGELRISLTVAAALDHDPIKLLHHET
jgi:hypothetical protein